jgi:hypothetical protein
VRIEKAAVVGQRRIVEADLDPVRYLATLIGAVVALLLDRPPGCCSWQRRGHERKH